MKKILFLVCVLSFFIPNVSSAKVSFSEIAWMGTLASVNAEWIELFNNGDTAIDLTGWKIIAADGTPTISLSGSIGANGFFLLERTSDASVPDIFANLIYTGALVDGGETLVLSSPSGSVEDTVIGGEDWKNIGGDKTTKNTPQWNGSAWVTSIPTPSASVPLGLGTTLETASTSPNTASVSSNSPSPTPSSHSGTASVAPILKPHEPLIVQAGRDRLGFPGVPLTFQGKGFLGESDSIVRDPSFLWSFGDGGFSSGVGVEHSFEFPGDYTVVLNGQRGEEASTARIKVKIVAPDLEITKVVEGERPFVEIRNRSTSEVNLWKATLRGGSFQFEFPPDTIIAPNAAVAFAKKVTGLDPKPGDEVALLWPGGRVGYALTIPAPGGKEKPVIADLEKKVSVLRIQLAEIMAKSASPALLVGAPAAPFVRVAAPESVRSPATSSPQVIEIPKPQSASTSLFSWPRRALGFLGSLVFGGDK